MMQYRKVLESLVDQKSKSVREDKDALTAALVLLERPVVEDIDSY